MNDRHDKIKQPEGNHFRLCQRLAALEGIAGELEIDQEKLPEEALHCTLAEFINDGLAMIDENMQLIYVNSRFCEIMGYSRDEVIGHSASDFLTEADKKIVAEQVARRKAGKSDPYELAWIRKDGQKAFVLMSPKPIFSADGSFKGSIAIITDITDRIRAEEKLLSTTQELEVRVQERTADLENVNKGLESEIAERKRTEQELRDSKNLFQKVFESQWDALFILNASNPARISDCNPAATRVFGYNRQEMLGRTTHFLHVDESSLRKFQEQLYPAVTEHGFFHLAEFEMKRKNGTVFPTEHTVLGLEDEKGERLGWVSVVRDITEREQAEKEKKKLEGQLLQTKKLEAISTLSGGVAQELSNLFQAVHGYVERLMWGKEQDDPRYQELLEITNAAFRGAVLSKRLLAFSGTIESKKHPIDLNQEIKKVHKLLMRTMPETIKLELHLANGSTTINGDPNQIEQALLALAVNARDAMPGGGKIIIETKRMMLEEDFLKDHAGAAMGECALITVSDTGPGLGQKTLEHVFDPFYSKDDSSEKTGLGLSMVYGIVKNHGGYISCSSEPEVGTTFMIYLPVSERETAQGTGHKAQG
jgi:PAS domain S-box-containing protein